MTTLLRTLTRYFFPAPAELPLQVSDEELKTMKRKHDPEWMDDYKFHCKHCDIDVKGHHRTCRASQDTTNIVKLEWNVRCYKCERFIGGSSAYVQ